MKRIFISFSQGDGKNIVEKIIKTATQSRFIHCEMIVGNDVYDYSEMLNNEGKIKWNLNERIKTDSYKKNRVEIFEIKISENDFFEVQKYIEEYYLKHNYDKDMKTFAIGGFGIGNDKYVKGSFNENVTICSHFCFKILKYIANNYYSSNYLLNYRINEIEDQYYKKREYITPGHLYKVFKGTGLFIG